MTLNSRRAFLKGRVPKRSAWERFCDRVHQEFAALLRPFIEPRSGLEHRLFMPTESSQVHAVFLLAQHFDVPLALGPMKSHDSSCHTESALWIDPRHLNRCEPIDEQGRFYLEPGATMQQLVSVGLTQFSELPADMRVIDWLADVRFHRGRPLAHSGLQMASMVLADCSVARLGPFGAQSGMSLNSRALQYLIPQLFQLLETPIGRSCAALPAWPGRYRLDALVDPDTINLAYLVLGQGLELGWVEWVVLDGHACLQPAWQARVSWTAEQTIWAQELDAAVQKNFDPKGRFLALL